MGSAAYGRHLLYHDAVDAHVLGSSGEVEEVHPAESQTEYHEPKVLHPATKVECHRRQEENCLDETRSRVTEIRIKG